MPRTKAIARRSLYYKDDGSEDPEAFKRMFKTIREARRVCSRAYREDYAKSLTVEVIEETARPLKEAGFTRLHDYWVRRMKNKMK